MDPTEAEYSKFANGVLERLMTGSRVEIDLPPGLALADLERDIADYRIENEILADRGVGPGTTFDDHDPVPVALSEIVEPTWDAAELALESVRGTYAFEMWTDRVLSVLERPGSNRPDFGLYELERLQAGFLRRATSFLATRAQFVAAVLRGDAPAEAVAAAARVGQGNVPTPGCVFSVSTNSHGLRVVYSGAYRRVAAPFGWPTSPVQGMLQGGDYQFGVDGGHLGRRRWDNTILRLPGPPSTHLNF